MALISAALLGCASTEPVAAAQYAADLSRARASIAEAEQAGAQQFGNAELVRDEECGLLVPPGDPGALAAALRRYVRDPLLRAAHARAARARAVADFSMEAMVRGYLSVYDDLLERAALARAA